MTYARRKDANHNDIAEELTRLGFHVADTSRLGGGFPDMIVTGYNRRTDTVAALLVEVKSDFGKATVDERIFYDEYPADGPYVIVRTAEGVLRWFGAIERA